MNLGTILFAYRGKENTMQLTEHEIIEMKQHALNLYNAIPKSKRSHYLWDLNSLDLFFHKLSTVIETLNNLSESKQDVE